MIFWKKNTEQKKEGDAPPPWANIDSVPQTPHQGGRMRVNIFAYVQNVTGFGTWGTRILLFGFSLSMLFIAYAFYYTAHTGPALPRDVERPAMDKYASSSVRI